MKLFLTAIEEEEERAGLQGTLEELVLNQLSITLVTSYGGLSATTFPGLAPTYERLVEAIIESVAPGMPEGHLQKEAKTLKAAKIRILASPGAGYMKRTCPHAAGPAMVR